MYELEVFYDGACPLCRREVEFLARRNRHGRVLFTDIAAPTFVVPAGRTYDELMARIQGRLPNGDWVEGMDVFRKLYAACGYGWVSAVMSAPLLAPLFEVGYRAFAKNRLRMTGRCTAESCALPVTSQRPCE